MLIRALSAFLGVSLLYGTWHFFQSRGLILLCSLITLIACFEFSYMIEKKSRVIQCLFVSIAYAFFLVFSFFSQSMLTFISFFILLVTYFILCSSEAIPSRVNKLTAWTVGILYCGAFTGVVNVGVKEFSGSYFVALLILSFLTDTFAYLGGRAIGKTPLAPQISPKKTWEGSVVGLLGGAGIGVWYLSTLEHSSPTWIVVVTCIAASIFSQVGDLFESTIKRYSDVKDSGKILPGHGGILDRIDGLLFAGPIVFLWMQAFL